MSRRRVNRGGILIKLIKALPLQLLFMPDQEAGISDVVADYGVVHLVVELLHQGREEAIVRIIIPLSETTTSARNRKPGREGGPDNRNEALIQNGTCSLHDPFTSWGRDYFFWRGFPAVAPLPRTGALRRQDKILQVTVGQSFEQNR